MKITDQLTQEQYEDTEVLNNCLGVSPTEHNLDPSDVFWYRVPTSGAWFWEGEYKTPEEINGAATLRSISSFED